MFKTSIGGRLIESAAIAVKIVSTVVDSKLITFKIWIAFVRKCQSLDQAPMLDRI